MSDHVVIPRPACRHGVIPQVEVGQQVAIGTAPIETYMPGRVTLVYDCPTPWECAAEAYRTTPYPIADPSEQGKR